MPSDRQSRRAVLLATGVVCLTISTGCFTSPFVRRAPEPAPEAPAPPSARADDQRDVQNGTYSRRVDSSVRSASVQAADVPAAGATLATPFLLAPGRSSPAPAGEFPLELQAEPARPAGEPATSAPGSPAPPRNIEPAPPASTPLLDAAIRRVADVTREQREAIASAPTPDMTDRTRPKMPADVLTKELPGPKTRVPDRLAPELDGVPLPARLSQSPQDDHQLAEPPSVAPKDASAPAHASPPAGPPTLSSSRYAGAVPKPETPAPVAGTEAAVASATLSLPPGPELKANEDTTLEVQATDREPADEQPRGATVDSSTDEHDASLRVGELRLCRRVLGFGSFEPLVDDRVKVGQQILIYCELTGIQYEERGADFVSRISSRVEIKAAKGGPVLWSRALGDAEDLCHRRRRDYYVNAVFDLPKTLGPGSYRMRLLQTDLIAGSSTSSEILLEITR
jgi:hypothetical protein